MHAQATNWRIIMQQLYKDYLTALAVKQSALCIARNAFCYIERSKQQLEESFKHTKATK
jgi:hypothetical protein